MLDGMCRTLSCQRNKGDAQAAHHPQGRQGLMGREYLALSPQKVVRGRALGLLTAYASPATRSL